MNDLPPYYLYLTIGGFFTLWSLWGLLRYALILRWSRITGKVIGVHARWRSVITEGLDDRDAILVYEYVVDGKTYTREMAINRAQRAKSTYEAGAPLRVYVHPRYPQRSQIEQAFDQTNYVWFGFGVVVLILVIGAVWG